MSSGEGVEKVLGSIPNICRLPDGIPEQEKIRLISCQPKMANTAYWYTITKEKGAQYTLKTESAPLNKEPSYQKTLCASPRTFM